MTYPRLPCLLIRTLGGYAGPVRSRQLQLFRQINQLLVCKTVVFFLRTQATVNTSVTAGDKRQPEMLLRSGIWSECKNGEGEWKETACEVRALCVFRRKRPKTTVFQSNQSFQFGGNFTFSQSQGVGEVTWINFRWLVMCRWILTLYPTQI